MAIWLEGSDSQQNEAAMFNWKVGLFSYYLSMFTFKAWPSSEKWKVIGYLLLIEQRRSYLFGEVLIYLGQED